uniref:Uncharacterized protein n=1 Tax=Monodelphis domestica TaxID=13616 RepID=A0A5F8HD63_MONDO
MLTLVSKLMRDKGVKDPIHLAQLRTPHLSVRYKLLIKKVVDLEANLPCTCKVNFPDS